MQVEDKDSTGKDSTGKGSTESEDALMKAALEAAQLKAALDKMRVQTMHNMVDDVTVVKDGMYSKKKVMYLTNSQAGLFTENTMIKCIEALDIGEPKFVINLLPSAGLAAQVWQAAKKSDGDDDDADAAALNAQLLLFMKTCIIPIAIQTHALILVSGSNSCSLGSALSIVAVTEQARFGHRCPFTVVALAAEKDVHYQATKGSSQNCIATQVCNACASWHQHTQTKRPLFDSNTSSQVDLIPGAARYVIFEEIDEATKAFNFLPRRSFESVLIHLMTKRLPCIAIQCCARNLERLADLASRNVPVLLLDSNKRSFTYNKTLKDEARDLIEQKAYAFPLIPEGMVDSIRLEKSYALTLESRKLLLHFAMDMIDEQMKKGIPEHYDSSLYAFFHSVLHVGADAVFDVSEKQEDKQEDGGLVKPLYEKLEALEHEKQSRKDLVQPVVPHELASEAIAYIQNTEVRRVELLQKFLSPDKNPDSKLPKEGENSGPDKWLALFDVFTNPCFHSSSIHDVIEIKNIITTIAKIDRLPQETSLESLRTLQDAWDHVEIYHEISSRYKFITLFFYALVLGLGVSVTFVSILGSTNFLTNNNAGFGLIMISFFTTFVVAMVSFLNPAIRWQSLRMGALSIESNIFTFRARAGVYRVDASDNNSIAAADELLTEAITEVKTAVLEGADIKNTQFYSYIKPSKKHQQHRLDFTGGAFGLPEKPVKRYFTWCCCWSFEVDHDDDDEDDHDDDDSEHCSREDKYQSPSTHDAFMDSLHRHPSRIAADPLDNPNNENTFMEDNPMNPHKLFRLLDLERGRPEEGKEEEEVDVTDDAILNFFNKMKADIDEKEVKAGSRLLEIEENPKPLSKPSAQPPTSKETSPMVEYRLDEIVYFIRHIRTRKKQEEVAQEQSQDNHYSPLTPEKYIAFRLQPSLAFYTHRITPYYRTKWTGQVVTILGSVLIGALAYYNMDTWTAAVTICTAGVASVLEFHGTERKINRYSFTIHSLRNLIHWWETLPPIDRSVVENIDRLVLTGEDLLQKEQQAWKSTSQAMKMLQKASKEKDKDKDGKDKKD